MPLLEDITIGQYLPGESPIHRLDPRTKLLSTILLMVILFLTNRLADFAFVFLIALMVIVLARLPLTFVFKGLKPLVWIILLTMVLNFLLTPGTPRWHLGPLTITQEGFAQGIFLAVRLLLLVMATSLLTLTTSPISLTDGLEGLLKPLSRFGFPAHELAMMMSIALRFIPTFAEEAEKITKAQEARGADFQTGNLLARARSMLPLLVPLFVSAFRRADDLALAMEARCYRGGMGRTKMKELKMTGSDYLALFLLAALLVYVITVRLGWI